MKKSLATRNDAMTGCCPSGVENVYDHHDVKRHVSLGGPMWSGSSVDVWLEVDLRV